MTGAGIVAIGGMMIRPRWVLPLLDLTAPTFLFRVSANGLKFIFSTQSRVFQTAHFRRTPRQVIRDAPPPSICGSRIALETDWFIFLTAACPSLHHLIGYRTGLGNPVRQAT